MSGARLSPGPENIADDRRQGINVRRVISDKQMTVQKCRVQGVFMAVSEMGAAPTVLLDIGGESMVPIYIGLWEAISISNALNSEVLPRPITHDLIIEVFRNFEIALDALHIDALEGGVFYAKLMLRQGSRTEMMDCRPSDGIAIALRYPAPIMIEDTVIEAAAVKKADLPQLVDLKEYL